MAYVQGESLKVIVPFLNGFELPAALAVSVVNAFKSIQVTAMTTSYSPIKIDIDAERPESALETCSFLLDMLTGLMTGPDPLGVMDDSSACGLQLTLGAIKETLVGVHSAIFEQRRDMQSVTPCLTEPTCARKTGTKSSAA